MRVPSGAIVQLARAAPGFEPIWTGQREVTTRAQARTPRTHFVDVRLGPLEVPDEKSRPQQVVVDHNLSQLRAAACEAQQRRMVDRGEQTSQQRPREGAEQLATTLGMFALRFRLRLALSVQDGSMISLSASKQAAYPQPGQHRHPGWQMTRSPKFARSKAATRLQH